MPSNKFVLKCGNFAVLVDPYILPRGTNKDTSWFTEHHKEEISTLLKENIDLRIKQYLEARKQHRNAQTKSNKELTPNNPLCLKGQNFRLAAYFMKRHANLRCITKQQFCGLNVFPDRFVVCLTPCETDPMKRMAEEQIISAKHGTSEYFIGESEFSDASISIQKKKETLKQIVKKSCCPKMESLSKADSGDSLTKALPSVTEDEQNVAQPAVDLSGEIQDVNNGGKEDCMNSVQSELLLPAIKLEEYINRSQPAPQSCHQPPRSIQQLKAGLKSTGDVGESTLPNLKQNGVNKKTQTTPRRVSAQSGTNCAVRVISGGSPPSPVQATVETNSPESLRKPSRRKTPVKTSSHSKRSVKGKADCLVLASRDAGGYLLSTLSSPQDFCHVNKHKRRRLTTQNKPAAGSEMPPPSHSGSESQSSASSTALMKGNSRKENVPRTSRLRRPKKAGAPRSEDVALR
ncbi:protein SLX4IP isoform X2 [Amblyraja radiata]|uniref:protein SLX4IP isoform X2 n=1 Tax=Amblyraja radiata TaxID=386614 RepID=UPI00140275F5|nr:protein SLX4IP isoform X2 [Amblyraja radiata]